MKARKEILKDAIESVRTIDVEKWIEENSDRDKRSVFGVITSLLRGEKKEFTADADIFGNHRAILQKIKSLPEKRRFMGVRTDDLHIVIESLFCDKGNVLPVHMFRGYDQKDLLAYVEICRRMFVAKYKSSLPLRGVEDLETSDSDVKNDGISEKSNDRHEKAEWKRPEWGFSGEAKMSLTVAIFEENRQAAQFVIQHKDECKDNKLIREAKKILEK